MGVLVTGGAGYIGSHIVLELLAAGEDVVVLDNLSTGIRGAVPSSADFVEGDVADRPLVTQLLLRNSIDTIFHLAGSIIVPESIAAPLSYYRNNTCGSASLLSCAVETKVPHFIFSSTAAVYGIPDKNPVPENASLCPISPYGSSKMMTELMLRDAAVAHSLSYVVFRYFNVAGADPNGQAGQNTPKATHLIKVALEAALGQRPYLEIFGTDYPTPDGTCIRDFVHVSDLARAHVAALGYLRAGGKSEVLNCGYGTGFSVMEVVSAVLQATKAEFPVRLGPRREGDAAVLVAQPGRIAELLGWKPQYTEIDRIIRHALSWEVSKPQRSLS